MAKGDYMWILSPTPKHTMFMPLLWGAEQIISHKAFYPYVKWETMPILLIWLSVWLDRMIIGWVSNLLEEMFMVPRQRFPETSTPVTAWGWHLWFWVACLNNYCVDFQFWQLLIECNHREQTVVCPVNLIITVACFTACMISVHVSRRLNRKCCFDGGCL